MCWGSCALRIGIESSICKYGFSLNAGLMHIPPYSPILINGVALTRRMECRDVM